MKETNIFLVCEGDANEVVPLLAVHQAMTLHLKSNFCTSQDSMHTQGYRQGSKV